MQRINLSLDENTDTILRAVSIKQKRSISEMAQESIQKSLAPVHEQAQLILNAEDEAELLDIIENDEYRNWDAIKQRVPQQ